MRPILIMSSERSGSNLLRRMLGAHPEVAAPPPPHLWRVLHPVLPWYGPLSEEAGWRALLQDALAMTRVEGSHLRWRHELGAEEVLPHVRRRNLSGIAGALYSAYAAREGKAVWACKENNLFDHAHRILDVYPEARIVYLARDGRDVACSIQKVPTHDQHAYFIAREWREEQLKCIDVLQEQADPCRCRLLRYEELIERPEEELRGLCPFLGLPFAPGMLEYHEEEESRQDAAKTAFWRNLDKPVMPGNKGKFLRELSEREIGIFEAVAADALELLGYPLCSSVPPRIGGVRRWVYGVQNRRQKRAKRGKLYEEKGRAERDEVMRSISRGRRQSRRRPLAPPLRYGA